MLALFTAFMAAAVGPDAAMSEAICDVGRVALNDLPTARPGRDTYYASALGPHRDLLEVCPQLRSELPTGYSLANDVARSRASLPAPIPGQHTKPAFLYSIAIPAISTDLKTAIVYFNISCPGNCGGRSEGRYVRTFSRWQRQGKIRLIYVS